MSLTVVSLDPNQLLTLCQVMRDTMLSLDGCIRMTQLRLTTMRYIRVDSNDASLQCFDHLIELRNLNQLMVNQLEELHQKWLRCSEQTFDYQIASQQLVYFATELQENYHPRVNETFEMANKCSIRLMNEVNRSPDLATTDRYPSGDSRARETLLRLKQSMKENENLIETIACNVEHTKSTIDKIYDSLKSSGGGLEQGRKNVIEAVDYIRGSNRCRFITFTIIFLVCLASIFYFVKYML